MFEFENYSSLAAHQVAEMAKAKGLLLLEGKYNGCTWDSDDKSDTDCKGYGVVKAVAGQYFTLDDDGSVYQDYIHDGPCVHETVCFDLTMEEAKELILNFNGTIKDYPKFFAYVRVYSDEPRYYGYLQMLQLDQFAREHGITYEEKFVCFGGQKDMGLHPEDGTGIDDIISCCEKSFSKMQGTNSFLVVSDITRLNDNIAVWHQAFNIISVGFNEMGYTEYYYHESAKVKEMRRFHEKCFEDSEYEQMSREHREMTMEQDDQTF